jgi:signal transduction histidine kinase
VTFRIRLTLLFVVTLAVLGALSSTITYEIVQNRLREQDRRVTTTLATTAALADTAELALDRIAGPGDAIWLITPAGRVEAKSYHAPGSTLQQVRAYIAEAMSAGAVTASAPIVSGGRAIALHGTAQTQSALGTVRRTLMLVDLAAVLLAAIAGAVLASRALRPVERMRKEADRIPGYELGRRLPEGRNDELGRLAQAFNRLLARAQTASEEQEQFIADASHELKTPVMAIEGHARILSRALRRNEVAQAQASASVVEHESHRLALTLRDLLELAESGAATPLRDPVRLDLVAQEASAEVQAIDPERSIHTAVVPATVRGDANRLRELLLVLLDNADKYSPQDQPVDLTVARDPHGAVTVRIRDRGLGLTVADRETVFGRFVRGSAAAGIPGSGLGLAIAHALAERHSASIALLDAPGGGTIAEVRFPASTPALDPEPAA